MALSIADRVAMPTWFAAALSLSGLVPPPEPTGSVKPRNRPSLKSLESLMPYKPPSTGLRMLVAESSCGASVSGRRIFVEAERRIEADDVAGRDRTKLPRQRIRWRLRLGSRGRRLCGRR